MTLATERADEENPRLGRMIFVLDGKHDSVTVRRSLTRDLTIHMQRRKTHRTVISTRLLGKWHRSPTAHTDEGFVDFFHEY